MTSSTVSMQFDVVLELDYDPFQGKTIDQFADTISKDLNELVEEVSPRVKYVYTGLKSVAEFDD